MESRPWTEQHGGDIDGYFSDNEGCDNNDEDSVKTCADKYNSS